MRRFGSICPRNCLSSSCMSRRAMLMSNALAPVVDAATYDIRKRNEIENEVLRIVFFLGRPFFFSESFYTVHSECTLLRCVRYISHQAYYINLSLSHEKKTLLQRAAKASISCPSCFKRMSTALPVCCTIDIFERFFFPSMMLICSQNWTIVTSATTAGRERASNTVAMCNSGLTTIYRSLAQARTVSGITRVWV